MSTITTACPVSLWPAYVQFRRAIAPDEATADSPPSGHPAWEREGASFVASSMPRQEWLLAALAPLEEPEWGADMALAAQAQAALVVWPDPEAEEPGDPPLAQPDAITVIVGPAGRDAVGAMGLERRVPVNINTDDAATLAERLSGVGETLAQAIIDGRPWASPADLAQIGGISEAMMEGWMAEPGLEA